MTSDSGEMPAGGEVPDGGDESGGGAGRDVVFSTGLPRSETPQNGYAGADPFRADPFADPVLEPTESLDPEPFSDPRPLGDAEPLGEVERRGEVEPLSEPARSGSPDLAVTGSAGLAAVGSGPVDPEPIHPGPAGSDPLGPEPAGPEPAHAAPLQTAEPVTPVTGPEIVDPAEVVTSSEAAGPGHGREPDGPEPDVLARTLPPAPEPSLFSVAEHPVQRPAADGAGAVTEAGAEATVPVQPIFSAGSATQRHGTAARTAIEEATTTPIIPAVPAEPAPPGRPEPDAATTMEIPRIDERAFAAVGSPTAAMTRLRPPRPEPQTRVAADPPNRPLPRKPPNAPVPPGPPDLGDRSPATAPGGPGGPIRRGVIAAAVALGLLVLVYGLDVAFSRGEVPRGVTVAGVDVGGLNRSAAEQRLREQLEPRLTRPIALRAGDVDTTLDPGQSGLALNWPATLDQAGEQPLNPWTRLTSLFTTREVGVVTNDDQRALTAAVEGLRPKIDRTPVDGTIRFQGATPIVVDPVSGQRLDTAGAAAALLANWVRGGVVQVPVTTVPVNTTPDALRATLHDIVEPAVSGPVTVTGDGGEAVLKPQVIARALRFTPDGHGGLAVTVDNPTVIAAAGTQLGKTEQPGQDAMIVIQDGKPVVQPSVVGRSVDWDKSLQPLPAVLQASGAQRTLPAVYATTQPKLTTDQANQFGITTVIGSFTTKGFAKDSGVNIRRAAEQVNGAIVRPGQTFSLNGYTGPRTAATGYVDAGIIDHGRPARGIGGGVSQFSTTLYNASYFAGMTNVEHKEHSFYISRYPAGREATVFEGAIDLKFRNDSPTGILIQTAWTPSSITVTIWGTKHVNVESITGPRTNLTDPATQVISDQPCSPTNGEQGFTVTDTRVIRDANSGAEIKRETRKVVYEPEPKVICTAPPPPPPSG